MSRIAQIKAEQKKLADELASEMLKERANVLATREKRGATIKRPTAKN